MTFSIQRALTYWRIPTIRLGLTYGAIATMLACAIWVFLVTPMKASFTAKRAQLIYLTAERDSLAHRRDEATRFTLLTEATEGLDQRLEMGAERSRMVELFAAISEKAGTRIIHGANQLGPPQDGVAQVLQELTVEGGYAEIRAFMAEIAGLETLTVLVAADLSSNVDGALVRAKLRLTTLTNISPEGRDG
jgi:hypothetical protein